MNSRPLLFLNITAISLVLAGGVSGRNAGSGVPFPGSTPEIVNGERELSNFSAIIERNRGGHIVRIRRGAVTQSWQRGPGGRIEFAGSDVPGAPAFDYLLDPANPGESFDPQNRRRKCQTAGGTWTYQYDADGRRVKKHVVEYQTGRVVA